MNRRSLLSAAAPAALALAGAAAAASVAAAASSPILDTARQLAALDRQHEQADAANASKAEMDRIMDQMRPLERFIIAASPTTTAEAAVILMVATGEAAAPAGTSALARVACYLADTAGADLAELGGSFYLPASTGLTCTGRA